LSGLKIKQNIIVLKTIHCHCPITAVRCQYEHQTCHKFCVETIKTVCSGTVICNLVGVASTFKQIDKLWIRMIKSMDNGYLAQFQIYGYNLIYHW